MLNETSPTACSPTRSWADAVHREFDSFHRGLADSGRITGGGDWGEKYDSLLDIAKSEQWVGVHKQIGDAMSALDEGLKQRTETWSGSRYTDWQREQLADAGRRLTSRLDSELSRQLSYLEIVPVDILKGDGHSPAHLARHPYGKVPTLEIDGFTLYETDAIERYVDEALPGAIHRVIYERLVDDFEPEVRRLLDYLGLPFDPACLDFHSTRRPVATASAEQVRRPLNRDGIGAWRAYAEWLGPLEDAVGDLERTYAG